MEKINWHSVEKCGLPDETLDYLVTIAVMYNYDSFACEKVVAAMNFDADQQIWIGFSENVFINAHLEVQNANKDVPYVVAWAEMPKPFEE